MLLLIKLLSILERKNNGGHIMAKQLFRSKNAFSAIGELTNVNGVKLYSEYYQNPAAKFKGTIIFINGSGTSMGEWGQNKQFFQCAKNLSSLFLWDRSGLGGSPNNL